MLGTISTNLDTHVQEQTLWIEDTPSTTVAEDSLIMFKILLCASKTTLYCFTEIGSTDFLVNCEQNKVFETSVNFVSRHQLKVLLR